MLARAFACLRARLWLFWGCETWTLIAGGVLRRPFSCSYASPSTALGDCAVLFAAYNAWGLRPASWATYVAAEISVCSGWPGVTCANGRVSQLCGARRCPPACPLAMRGGRLGCCERARCAGGCLVTVAGCCCWQGDSELRPCRHHSEVAGQYVGPHEPVRARPPAAVVIRCLALAVRPALAGTLRPSRHAAAYLTRRSRCARAQPAVQQLAGGQHSS